MAEQIGNIARKERRDTAANWKDNNPTPLQGEWCLETDTKFTKIGDGTTAWTSLLYHKNTGYNNVKWFGAKGDGITDDTAAVQAALTASTDLFFPSGTYLISGALNPSSCLNWHGSGKLKTASNIHIVDANTVSYNNMKITGLSFEGINGTSDTALSFIGTAMATAPINVKIRDCSFINFTKGIDSAWQFTTSHPLAMSITACVFKNCDIGVEFGAGSEYCNVTDSEFSLCSDVGIKIRGGNNKVSDNVISNNGYGVYVLGGGGNDAHGTIANNMINHNTHAGIAFEQITLGMIVEGNNLYNASAPVSTFGAILFLNNSSSTPVNLCDNVIDGGITFSGTNTFRLNNCNNALISGTILYATDNRAVGSLDDLTQTWVPVYTSSVGAFTTVTTTTAQFTIIGKLVWYKVSFVITAVGTATGSIDFTLPTTPSGTDSITGQNESSGVALVGTTRVNQKASLVKYDGTSAIVNTHPYTVTGFYHQA